MALECGKAEIVALAEATALVPDITRAPTLASPAPDAIPDAVAASGTISVAVADPAFVATGALGVVDVAVSLTDGDSAASVVSEPEEGATSNRRS